MNDLSPEDSKLQKQLCKFDHVVVLMLENRSFDNLLGNLYCEGDLKPDQKFEGLQFNKPHFNTVPCTLQDEFIIPCPKFGTN